MRKNYYKKYKVIYITNQVCFHDVGFIDVFFEKYKSCFDFVYLATEEEWDDERIKMGYQKLDKEYVVYSRRLTDEELKKLFNGVDTICIGSNNDTRIKKYYRSCKNAVFCTEHLSRFNPIKNFLVRLKYFLTVIRLFGNKPKYLLSYSFHGVLDYKKMGFKVNNLFLFGYFPSLPIIETSDILKKNKYDVFWCGRLIKPKHSELALEAINFLHSLNPNYKLTIVGDGPYKEKITSFIKKEGIDYVSLLPFQTHDKVLDMMKRSGLFLFTSDRSEGWGVVLNEAMSQGCISVCCAKAGSTRVLQVNNRTGLIFRNKKELKKQLLCYEKMNKDDFFKMSLEAKKRMECWSFTNAGMRFGEFLKSINENNSFDGYIDGPISCKKL